MMILWLFNFVVSLFCFDGCCRFPFVIRKLYYSKVGWGGYFRFPAVARQDFAGSFHDFWGSMPLGTH